MRFMNCRIRQSSILEGVYFVLVEAMPTKYSNFFLFELQRLDEYFFPYSLLHVA